MQRFDLKEGTVYPWITQFSKNGARCTTSKDAHEYSNHDYETSPTKSLILNCMGLNRTTYYRCKACILSKSEI